MKRLIFGSLILILVFHFLIAGHFYLYDKIWWLDIVMHLVGGAWLALVFEFIAKRFWNLSYKNLAVRLILGCGFVLIVGLFWEIFYEYLFLDVLIFKKHPLDQVFDPFNLPDTFKDLLNDVIGGIIVFCAMYFKDSKSLEKSPKKVVLSPVDI